MKPQPPYLPQVRAFLPLILLTLFLGLPRCATKKGGKEASLAELVASDPFPLAVCAEKVAEGSYLGYFTYLNFKGQTVSIAHGSDNQINRQDGADELPDKFLPVKDHDGSQVFAVAFDGKPLTWTLKKKTATLDTKSPDCRRFDFKIAKIWVDKDDRLIEPRVKGLIASGMKVQVKQGEKTHQCSYD